MRMLLLPIAAVACYSLPSCAPPEPPADPVYGGIIERNKSENATQNSAGDLVLKEIPPMPGGTKVAAKEPAFRSRTLDLPDGRWKVDFEEDAIRIVTGKGKKYSLPMAWYPEEGGADAALCTAYLDGATTWIVLNGSSDYIDETTRIRFERGQMKEVIKHRIPGPLGGLVPAGDRIKSQAF